MSIIKKSLSVAAAAVFMITFAGCTQFASPSTAVKNATESSETTQTTSLPADANKILTMPGGMSVANMKGTYAVLDTTDGTITLEMYPDAAPKAVENFLTHCAKGYYNGLTWHRIIKDFMIQSGDPKGNGSGGESIWGKAFADEFSSTYTYSKYTICMANSGANTNGSQFFINTADNSKNLPANTYTIFGKVVSGQDAVDKLNVTPCVMNPTGGDTTPSKPSPPVYITRAYTIPKS